MLSYIVYPLFIAKCREYYLKLGRKERKEESRQKPDVRHTVEHYTCIDILKVKKQYKKKRKGIYSNGLYSSFKVESWAAVGAQCSFLLIVSSARLGPKLGPRSGGIWSPFLPFGSEVH